MAVTVSNPVAGVEALTPPRALDFDAVYTETAGFVWTNARRLGIVPSQLDDVVQDVFVVVHRKLPSFEPNAAVKTWVCGILINVVRDRRRAHARKGQYESYAVSPDKLPSHDTPERAASTSEALRLVQRVFGQMSHDRVELLVLSLLECMSVTEIAAATEQNENTLRSRLRAARQEFDALYLQMTKGVTP